MKRPQRPGILLWICIVFTAGGLRLLIGRFVFDIPFIEREDTQTILQSITDLSEKMDGIYELSEIMLCE